MNAVHVLNKHAVEKCVSDEELSFFLSNSNGGFAHFSSSNLPTSKYQGFFAKTGAGLLKLVESLSVQGCQEKVVAVENAGYSAMFHHSSFYQTFFVPMNRNCLVYEVSRELPVELFLDVRMANDFRQWGRHYRAYEKDGVLIVEFVKKTDSREDNTNAKEEFQVAVAIKHDGCLAKINGEWVRRNYGLDARRNSASERYVYNAATISARTFVVSVAASVSSAIKEAGLVFKSLGRLKRESKSHYDGLCKSSRTKELGIASNAAAIALDKLCAGSGLYAGLPWFFQEWTRDELVSCAALGIPERRGIVLKHLNRIMEDGRLPNVETGYYKGSPSCSADSIGWLFKRASELVEEKALSDSDLKKIRAALKKSIDCLVKNHCRNGFIMSGKNETWMDTEFGGDSRKGACIEIQAMQLNMYSLMHRLTGDKTYSLLENSLRQNVRKFFWNGSVLADRLNDFTVRPNLFIAAYVYPQLLSKKEWETCITAALKKLWLDWGGLATIDRSHRNFHGSYTGETNESYHRGDSWFWINNLAAIVMHSINKRKFGSYIGKIAAASATDILWKGAIGCASELSSASEQRAEGCLNQAWSNATFIELAKLLRQNK